MKRMWQVGMAIIRQIGEVNMMLVAAGIAFYSMLAIFPALTALISLWGVFADQDVVLEELQLLHGLLPDSVYAVVRSQVIALTGNTASLSWTGFASLVIALWSSRSGVAALILGLNLIHGTFRRGSVQHYLYAILITLALIGVGIVTLASLVIVPVVLAFIPLSHLAALLIELVRWGAALVALYCGLTLVYRYGPNNRGERMGWFTPGALLVASLWGLVSFGFSVYLSDFSNYSEVYGSLGAAVAMLLWLWISALLVLLGAALNVQLRRRRLIEEAMEGLP